MDTLGVASLGAGRRRGSTGMRARHDQTNSMMTPSRSAQSSTDGTMETSLTDDDWPAATDDGAAGCISAAAAPRSSAGEPPGRHRTNSMSFHHRKGFRPLAAPFAHGGDTTRLPAADHCARTDGPHNLGGILIPRATPWPSAANTPTSGPPGCPAFCPARTPASGRSGSRRITRTGPVSPPTSTKLSGCSTTRHWSTNASVAGRSAATM